MVKNKKIILALMSIILSIGVINTNTALAAETTSSSQNQKTEYANESSSIDYAPEWSSKHLFTKEGSESQATDKNGVTWHYSVFQDDGTLRIQGTSDPKSELEIPSELNGHSVTQLSSLFYEGNGASDEKAALAKITKVKVPSSVTALESKAFNYCTNLNNIELPSTLKNMSKASFLENPWFEKQRNSDGFVIINGILLEGKNASGNITIPSNVTSIGIGAFESLDNLTGVKIPSGVTSVGENAFAYCRYLTNVEFSNNLTGVTSYAFHGCDRLIEVKIPAGDTRIGRYAFERWVTLKRTVATNNSSSGAVKSGWYYQKDNWFWRWSDGSNRTGWYNENGSWYYFYGNGQMATAFIDLGGTVYYLNPNSNGSMGAMKTGWVKINGYWYYFNPNADGYKGAMKRGWIYDNGNWYYLYYDGTMACNTTVNGYYVNSSGAWVY